MENPESLSAPSQFTTRTGTTSEELAVQCQFWGSWEDLDTNDKSRWVEAIEALAEAVTQERDTTFSKLTRQFLSTYHAADKCASTSSDDRLKFEACVRHVVNMVTAEDAADVKDAMEYNWPEWVASKQKEK